MNTESLPFRRRIGPALTLVLLAPLIAEVLPGATRVSALFVLPLEMCIWGGGALLVRAAVRHWNLGWLNMLLLAFALSIAEECLIQQTSFATMVLQIVPGGPPYARAYDVNYLYFLWALFYESVLVVLVPVIVTELIFKSRRNDPWLRLPGTVVTLILFLVACVPAWYSWTQFVRTKVFHVGLYQPSPGYLLAALAAIAVLILVAIGPMRRGVAVRHQPIHPWNPWLLALLATLASAVWYGICLLAFGARPQFPPGTAVGVGLALAVLALYLLPRMAADAGWRDTHRLALSFGAAFGTMAVNFVGFYYGSSPLDWWGKIILNGVAAILGLWLALAVARDNARA